MSDLAKTVAEQALGSLLNMPPPKTARDFRRAVVMAALIGRQIEHDFQQEQTSHTNGPVPAEAVPAP